MVKDNSVDHQKQIIQLINQAAAYKDNYQVFNDFLEMSAISISNSVDVTHRQERENRYLEIINSYDQPQQLLFPQMLAHLVELLEDKAQTIGPEDVFGPIYLELELYRREKGQFFTPQHISDMMAKLTFDHNGYSDTIAQQGFISLSEPTCGSGVMITSLCKVMKEANLNYCTQLLVIAIDIDLKCVFMTYLQLALYGVPAVVIHGNFITMQEYSRWYTPIYILHGWRWRRHSASDSAEIEDKVSNTDNPPSTVILKESPLISDNLPLTSSTSLDSAETLVEEETNSISQGLINDERVGETSVPITTPSTEIKAPLPKQLSFFKEIE